MSLAALKQRIAQILDPPRTVVAGLPTGVSALDALLTDGGVPRGRLTEVLGPRGGGKTTLVRRIIEEAVRARHWVAYVDATRTLAPTDWTRVAAGDALWVVRPRDPGRAAWCADVLLRSGAFALVVLDGAAPLARPVAVRLAQCAREADAALLIVGDDAHGGAHAGAPASARSGASGGATSIAVRLRVARRERRARRAGEGRGEGGGPERASSVALRITVEKGGVHQTVEVSCAIGLARRLCTDPAIPDRRGVAPTRARSDGGDARVAGGERGGGAARGGARKRRCAEPEVERESFIAAVG